jgi:hypothetical protein
VPTDLGAGHRLQWSVWQPDLGLNPQYADLFAPEALADNPARAGDGIRVGAIVSHDRADGGTCDGSITFDTPEGRRGWPNGPHWQVQSWEPLTLSPSLLCHCGDHGYIREGRWVTA